jgi:hypothetical protein
LIGEENMPIDVDKYMGRKLPKEVAWDNEAASNSAMALLLSQISRKLLNDVAKIGSVEDMLMRPHLSQNTLYQLKMILDDVPENMQNRKEFIEIIDKRIKQGY